MICYFFFRILYVILGYYQLFKDLFKLKNVKWIWIGTWLMLTTKIMTLLNFVSYQEEVDIVLEQGMPMRI